MLETSETFFDFYESYPIMVRQEVYPFLPKAMQDRVSPQQPFYVTGPICNGMVPICTHPTTDDPDAVSTNIGVEQVDTDESDLRPYALSWKVRMKNAAEYPKVIYLPLDGDRSELILDDTVIDAQYALLVFNAHTQAEYQKQFTRARTPDVSLKNGIVWALEMAREQITALQSVTQKVLPQIELELKYRKE